MFSRNPRSKRAVGSALAVLVALLGLTDMAAGITQTGAGANILYQDDTHADADLDAVLDVYSFDDIGLKYPVDWVPLGTTPQSYLAKVSLQNGDGVGTAATRLKVINATVIFNAGKTLIVSTVGSVNRTLEFGDKILGPNGKPSGKNGCLLSLNAATTLRGTVKIYASKIAQRTGGFVITPGTTGLLCDIANCILEAYANVAIGVSGGEIADVYNFNISLLGTLSTHVVTQWNVLRAERITVHGNTPYLFNTAGVVRIRDLVLGGSPTVADLRSLGVSEWDLNEVVWTEAAPQIAVAISYVNNWSPFEPTVEHPDTGAKTANCPIRVLDKDGIEVVPVTYTDASGRIAINASDQTTRDSLKVRRAIGAPAAWEDREPFTVRVNMDGTTLAGLDQYDFKLVYARIVGAYGDRVLPYKSVILLGPPVSVPPPAPTDDVPYFEESDIVSMLDLEGQAVSVGGETTKGILRRYTEEVLAGLFKTPILGTGVVVTVKTESLSFLAIGVSLSTDGHTYKVRETRQIGDGALTDILLAEA